MNGSSTRDLVLELCGDERSWLIDMMKVKEIQERRWPLTHKECRSLLGLANYYHHFIQDFSKVARTLPNLVGKKWLSQEWDELRRQAFGSLRASGVAARGQVRGI